MLFHRSRLINVEDVEYCELHHFKNVDSNQAWYMLPMFMSSAYWAVVRYMFFFLLQSKLSFRRLSCFRFFTDSTYTVIVASHIHVRYGLLLACVVWWINTNIPSFTVDFGVSAQLDKTIGRRNTFIGTPYWYYFYLARRSLTFSYDVILRGLETVSITPLDR